MYVPIYSFLKDARSRDDAVSFGIESCHPTEFSTVASVVHHSTECAASFAACLSHFESLKVVVLHWTFGKYLKSKMASLSPRVFGEVEDPPSNLSACN